MIVYCDICKKPIERKKPRAHSFCCRAHLNEWNAKVLAEYNRTENPLNKPGGDVQNRIKHHNALAGGGEGKSYRKFYGKHEHRAIAEAMLGRPLRAGEVVHHIDGNKQNNDPLNIEVLSSQSEHCKAHDFGHCKKGVMRNVHKKE